MRLFSAAFKLEGNAEKSTITAIAKQRAEDWNLTKNTIHAISGHECAGDRHIATLIIKRALEGRPYRWAAYHTLGKLEITLTFFDQREPTFNVNP